MSLSLFKESKFNESNFNESKFNDSKSSGPRKSERFPYTGPVDVSVSTGDHLTGQATDISMLGVCAHLGGHLRLNDLVQLQMPLPAIGQVLFVTASVKHRVGSYYGFEFLWVSPEHGRTLEELLRSLVRQAGPPKPFQGLKKSDGSRGVAVPPGQPSQKSRAVSCWNKVLAFLKAS